jgi:hypothetical protein
MKKYLSLEAVQLLYNALDAGISREEIARSLERKLGVEDAKKFVEILIDK